MGLFAIIAIILRNATTNNQLSNNHTMKLPGYILCVLLLLGCNTLPDNYGSNSKTCIEVEKNLLLLKSFLDGKPDSKLTIIKVVNYFENLTGIESDSDGSDIGKFNPTVKDYIKWKKWYESNKERLYLYHDSKVKIGH